MKLQMDKTKTEGYFNYQNPASVAWDLFRAYRNKNDNIKHLIINELIKLMKDNNIKEIPENKNTKNVGDVV